MIKIYQDKFNEINTEYNSICSEIELNGISLDFITKKATIIGKLELLSWVMDMNNKQ